MIYEDIKDLTIYLGIYPEITKDYILKQISQEQIFEKYTGIPVNRQTLQNNSVLSPFRIDKNPTCNYWYNENGKLRFRDWSGDFHGDCFDACARRINVDVKNKYDFIFILHTIAKDFSINKYRNKQYREIYNNTLQSINQSRKNKKQTLQFKIIPRNWNYHDGEYWYKKYKLNTKDLYYVYPAQEIYTISSTGTYKVYSYDVKDPAYCYYGGKSDKGIDMWKVYFPLRREIGDKRFISNISFLQGKQLITCGKVGILTKSYKDVLCFKKFGLQAIAPSAESVLLTKDEYFWFRNKFDYVISCFDWDRAGIRAAWKHREIYGITPMMFTRGKFNSIDFGSKDFSDYLENNGEIDTGNLLKDIYLKYKQDLIDISNYNKNSLKWI